MKKQLFFIFASLVASVAILAISLLKTAHIRAASFAQPTATNKRFYLGEEMKPDHIMFPIKAAADQVELAMASPEKELVLSLNYAEKRWQYAVSLIDNGQPELAVITLLRGHNRLVAAVDIALALDDAALTAQVAQSIHSYDQRLTEMQTLLPQEYKSTFDQILQENQAIQQKLATTSN